MKLQPVRGTRDIFGPEALLFAEIRKRFEHWAQMFTFVPMETPLFEFSEVFKRSLGDETDIVSKEMYTFTDRSGDSLTLRPEGTASVARALISNGLLRDLPAKFYYCGPMFRHERPQKGRYRQFSQCGVEYLGSDSPLSDLEVIECAWAFLQSCGLEHKVELEINSLGDAQSRAFYRQQLREFFASKKDQLSEESQQRLLSNPLRILDSKEEMDQPWIALAPKMEEALTPTAKEFFQTLCQGLDSLSIPYRVNSRLVRGLDYYNHTVFEFVTPHLGAQGAVLSGGRYNHLVAQLGGPETPGVGWAAGLDRLALLLDQPQAQPSSVALICAESDLSIHCLSLLQKLRKAGIAGQMFFTANVSKQMKKADRRGCRYAILVGSQELSSGKFTLKNLATGEQTTHSFAEIKQRLKREFQADVFDPGQ